MILHTINGFDKSHSQDHVVGCLRQSISANKSTLSNEKKAAHAESGDNQVPNKRYKMRHKLGNDLGLIIGAESSDGQSGGQGTNKATNDPNDPVEWGPLVAAV